MANKKNNTALLLVVVGVFLLFNQRQRPYYAPQFQSVPPPPPQTSPNYQFWVKSIISLFGPVASLWEPGGPFYKEPIPQYDAGSPFWQDIEGGTYA